MNFQYLCLFPPLTNLPRKIAQKTHKNVQVPSAIQMIVNRPYPSEKKAQTKRKLNKGSPVPKGSRKRVRSSPCSPFLFKEDFELKTKKKTLHPRNRTGHDNPAQSAYSCEANERTVKKGEAQRHTVQIARQRAGKVKVNGNADEHNREGRKSCIILAVSSHGGCRLPVPLAIVLRPLLSLALVWKF